MYEYKAMVVKVVDADTVRMSVDMGFDAHLNLTFRLAGINAPEMSTPEGKAATEWLRERLPVGKDVYVRTVKDRREKYGRYLCYIFETRFGSPNEDAAVNTALVEAGHAVEYMA